jgi:hypothetical protein
MRFLFSFLRLKFIVYAVVLYFVLTTLGTVWTIFVAWALAAYMLFKWGPGDPKDGGQPWTIFATRGSVLASIGVPIMLPLVWPLAVFAMVKPGEKN